MQDAVEAVKIQVSRDYAPVYGETAEVYFLPKDEPLEEGHSLIVVADDTDQTQALGHHETTSAGYPLGFVFAKTDLENGSSWTVTLSHELLEMLGDPQINQVVQMDYADGSIEFRPRELCDAVESDDLGYDIALPSGKSVKVSDFVTPFYWMTWLVDVHVGYDIQGHITAPLQIAPGGYTQSLKVPGGSAWQQIKADLQPGGPPIPPGSRRWRRMLPDSAWRRSTID